jgi:hypothetical protein
LDLDLPRWQFPARRPGLSDLAHPVTDFDHATEADKARAQALAEAAGWRQQGSRYTHPTLGSYLVSDMDGWIDLCDNEGIEWDRTESPTLN